MIPQVTEDQADQWKHKAPWSTSSLGTWDTHDQKYLWILDRDGKRVGRWEAETATIIVAAVNARVRVSTLEALLSAVREALGVSDYDSRPLPLYAKDMVSRVSALEALLAEAERDSADASYAFEQLRERTSALEALLAKAEAERDWHKKEHESWKHASCTLFDRVHAALKLPEFQSFTRNNGKHISESVAEAITRMQAAEALLAECETVLEPFSQAEFDADRSDGDLIDFLDARDDECYGPEATIGDFRRARALLAKLKARTP